MSHFTLHNFKKRMIGLMVLIIFLFCCLMGRLFVIQIFNGKDLQFKATNQWIRDLPLTAERGKIYDSKGSALAVSYTTYNIYSRGREIKDANEVSAYLSSKLNMHYQAVYDKVIEKGVSEVLIKMQVEEDVAKEIYQKNLKGIFLSENNKRYYPYGDMLTQVLGFTTIDNNGQAGIENYYNKYLKGTDGYFYVQSDLKGIELENMQRGYVPGISGLDISLTIDSNIQLVVERVLKNVMQEQKAKSATCIIIDPSSGEILALSSKPSFDLNNVPRDDVLTLMSDVKNKAVVDVFEPGSTFKILTMSSAIQNGKAKLSDRFYCSGSRVVDGQKIKCWKSTGHGSQTLAEGFANSCNCVFMDLALRMGTGTFYNMLKAYGLSKPTGISIAGESSGILMPEKNVKNVDLARIGFGQAVAVTPLQLITSVSAAVNGGELVKPFIVKGVSDKNGTLAERNDRQVVRRVIDEGTSKILRDMMDSTVNKGISNSFVEGYPIGGKTGTAQKYENGSIARGKYISSFMGIYPVSNPRYCMLLLVDEPGTGAYYGSVVASPYAKEIFKGIFNYKDIKPESSVILSEVIMPDLVGKSLTEAVKIVSEIGLYFEIDGDGSMVVTQFPPAGSKLKQGDTIILVTE